MAKVNKQLLVPYSAEQMYNLVNDIESYPEFLPWCVSATIIDSKESELTASVGLKYAAFSQSFTTKNILEPTNKIIMGLVSGPFKHLKGEWVFEQINEQGSKVELNLEFEFENSFLGMAFGKVFAGVAEEFVDHFYKRAKVVYG